MERTKEITMSKDEVITKLGPKPDEPPAVDLAPAPEGLRQLMPLLQRTAAIYAHEDKRGGYIIEVDLLALTLSGRIVHVVQRDRGGYFIAEDRPGFIVLFFGWNGKGIDAVISPAQLKADWGYDIAKGTFE